MLSIRHLSLLPSRGGYGLTDISLDVRHGEIVVVIGKNGAGKSLLLETIADPDRRFDGEIIVNHFHSQKEPAKVKAHIGYVKAQAWLEPYLTGFEYLEMIASFYQLSSNVRVKRILELAKEFDCTSELYGLLERQTPATRQKVQLIASLLGEPSLLVWDEPLQNLDQPSQDRAIEALRKAVKKDSAALIATNNLEFAEQIADRLVLLSEGQLITEGTLSQLEHLSGQHKKDLAAVFNHLTAETHA